MVTNSVVAQTSVRYICLSTSYWTRWWNLQIHMQRM